MRGHAISAGEFVEKRTWRAHNMNVPAACYEILRETLHEPQ